MSFSNRSSRLSLLVAVWLIALAAPLFSQNYCTAKGDFPWHEWIAGVRIDGQEKTSSKSQYSDFSGSVNFNLPAGSTPIRLTTGFSYFNYDEYWRIWVDLNHDGDFTDAGEMLFDQMSPKGTDGTPSVSMNGNIVVPVNATPGVTRLRVSMKRGSAPSPCETVPFGEVEDYSVNLSATGDCKKDLGTGEILCFEHLPNGNLSLLTANQTTQTTYTLDRNGTVVSSTSIPFMPEDSFLVQGNKVVKKRANGTIAYQKTIGPSVLTQFPTIEAAVEMNDGSFMLGGIQRYYSGGIITADSLVLIKTNAALEFQSFVTLSKANPSSFNDHKLYGLIKTQSGDVVAMHQTSSTFFNKVYALILSKYSLQLQPVGSYYGQFTGFQKWRKVPCGLYQFNYSYNFPSIKNSVSGDSRVLLDLETFTVKTNWDHGNGSVSYCGNYSFESYTNNLPADNLTATSRLDCCCPPRPTPFNVKLTQTDGSVFEKRPPALQFDHIVRTGDTTVLFLGTTDGQIWASNPDCNAATARRPDLSLANLSIPNPSVPTGGVLSFNVDLKNTGNEPATGDYVIGVWLSSDNQLSDNDLITGFINTGNTPVGTIPGVLGGITVPAYTPPGAYYLILKTDLSNLILELLEGNNTLVSTATVNITASGPTDVCGFEVSANADGFTPIGAAGILSANVFRFSKYDATANTTTFREIKTDPQGGILSTQDFTLNEKCTMLLDENFVSATIEYNGIFLKKQTRNGTTLWLRQINLFDPGREVAISEANNGDILLTGVQYGGQYGGNTPWVMRLDYNGKQLVYTTLGYISPSKPNRKSSFVEGFNQGTYILVEDPNGDPFFHIPGHILYKVDWPNRSRKWFYEFPMLNVLKGVTETADGSTVILSYFADPDGGPSKSCTLIKFDANGQQTWTKNMSSMVPSLPAGAAIGVPLDISPIYLASEGGYITGMIRGFFGTGSLPNEALIIRLNANFDTLWTRRFVSPNNQSFRPLRALANGSFLGVRSFAGNSQLKLLKIGANGQSAPCSAPGQYCPSKGAYPWEDWIAGVSVGGNNNASGKSQYADFTGTVFQVNNVVPIALTAGYSYFGFDEYWRIWIDLNSDGDFDDVGEKVFEKMMAKPADGPNATKTITGNLNIPFGSGGTRRMRVSMKRGSYPEPCETLPFGEVEDYSVQVSFVLKYINLRVENWDAPATAIAGQPQSSDFDLKNDGTLPIEHAFAVGIFLSSDNLWGPNDQLLNQKNYPNLGLQTLPNEPLGFTVPASTPLGNYFLILKADFAEQISELDESDNTIVKNLTVTGGSGGGADLELSLTADRTQVPIYANVVLTYTVKNTGNQTVADAVIFTGICGQAASGFGQATQLVYAGIPAAPTVGSYNFVNQQWTIANLQPGQQGTLKITLFALTAAERKIVAFVQSQSPADPDSQPGSMPANCQPTQDDEAAWTINAGQNLLQPGIRNTVNEQVDIVDFAIFPNPAVAEVSINLEKWAGLPATISMYNHLGVKVLEKQIDQIAPGFITVDLKEIDNGQYFMRIETPTQRPVLEKLIVEKGN